MKHVHCTPSDLGIKWDLPIEQVSNEFEYNSDSMAIRNNAHKAFYNGELMMSQYTVTLSQVCHAMHHRMKGLILQFPAQYNNFHLAQRSRNSHQDHQNWILCISVSTSIFVALCQPC